MKSFKVKALSVHGLGNNMYSSGDIVTEANFPEGNCPELVREGFLTEIESDETPIEKKDDFTPKKMFGKRR